MYDVARRATFDLLGEWLVEMKTHLPQPSNMDDVIVAVCANKVHVHIMRIICILVASAPGLPRYAVLLIVRGRDTENG